jgi:hypothetical protein
MKRNYNGVNKGKLIPLTEVKPGMVFRMVDKVQVILLQGGYSGLTVRGTSVARVIAVVTLR